MNLLLDLYLTFAKVGVCTFGGGYAMLPILQREVADKKEWVTTAQLADYYAVGQCTPGVIAVNTATFVGYDQRGVLGGIVATLGVVTPSALIIGALASVLSTVSHIPWVGHAFAGVRACVVALILSAVLGLLRNGVTDVPSGVIFSITLVLAAFFGLSPVALVLCAGAVGLGLQQLRRVKP